MVATRQGLASRFVSWRPMGFAALAILFAACSPPPAEARRDAGPDGGGARIATVAETARPPRATETAAGLEMAGDVGLVPVEIPGFEKLPLARKKLLYHLGLAARAGDDLFAARTGPEAREISRLLAAILGAPHRGPSSIRDRLADFARKFWVSHGTCDAWSGERIVPDVIPGEIAAAAESAMRAGADLGVPGQEGLLAVLERLRPVLFGRGACSGLEPLVRDAVGADLAAVARHLKDALPFMDPDARAAMGRLVEFLETGDPRALESFERSRVRSIADVEAAFGFDWRESGSASPSGAFGAVVAFRDEKRSEAIRRLAVDAGHYERRMPWEIAFRRLPRDIRPPAAGAFVAVVASGGAGPVTPIGFSLAGGGGTRGPTEWKSLCLANVADAVERVVGDAVAREFSPDREILERRRRCGAAARWALTVLGEVIGRTSGRPAGEAEARLLEHAPAVVEMRAELVALHLAFDPRTLAAGILPDEECARAMYDDYASGAIEQLAAIGDAPALSRPEMVARQAIVNFAMERGAVRAERTDGRWFVRVSDHAAMRSAVADLLRDVQRIASTGDREAARRLVEERGTRFPEEWRRDVRRRARALGLPRAIAFVYPVLEAVRDGNGEIVDVRVSPATRFLDQRLAAVSRKSLVEP